MTTAGLMAVEVRSGSWLHRQTQTVPSKCESAWLVSQRMFKGFLCSGMGQGHYTTCLINTYMHRRRIGRHSIGDQLFKERVLDTSRFISWQPMTLGTCACQVYLQVRSTLDMSCCRLPVSPRTRSILAYVGLILGYINGQSGPGSRVNT